jgi:predicted HTH transcriptional regulator
MAMPQRDDTIEAIKRLDALLEYAVYHKSYRIAEPITVVVTPEAMTISSLPGPERSITDADLAACRMIGLHYRNRRIGDFLKELDLVEGRNTGVPVIVNVMRENGSPPPIFSSPENRDWLSVTLPVNPHFREMENPISQRTALKTALTSQRGTHKEEGEERDKLVDSGRVVEVMTAEEELAHIKVALKTALIHRSAKVVERMGILLQQLLRDKDTTIVA